MSRRLFSRRTVAIGVFGMAVALAVPVIAKSVAGADPSEIVPPVQPQQTPAPPDEAEPAQPQAARSIVYGTAAETTVTVYRQPLPGGNPEVLFSYQNPAKAEHERSVRPPELALSPDGRAVAYFARSGLRIRHLDSGVDEVVIGRTDHGGDYPTWTLDELNPPPGRDPFGAHWDAMHSLGDIAFSPDGRFLSFAGHWYEYRDHWVIELATGRHWNDKGSSELAWSPSSDRVAVAGPWYTDPGELAVSASGDFGRYTTIRPVPNPKPDLSYEDVEFAPSGKRLAFSTSDRSWPAAAVQLATSNLDGSGFTRLSAGEGGETGAFAFAPDGATLFSVQWTRDLARLVLVAHDLAGGRSREVDQLPADFAATVDLWVTPTGDVAWVAATAGEKGHGVFQERLFVYAPDGRLLEQSPYFSNATRFIGVG